MALVVSLVLGVAAVIVFAALLALVVKLLIRLVLAGSASVLLGILAGAVGLDTNAAIWLGLLSLPFMVLATWKLLGPIDGSKKRAAPKIVRQPSPPDIHPDPKPSSKDQIVEDGWEIIFGHLSQSDVENLEYWRIQCRHLLRFSDDDAGDGNLEIAEQAMLIRRHIPALANELVAALTLSHLEDVEDLVSQTKESLRSLGSRSFNLLEFERRRQRDALDIRTRHVVGRMRSSDDLPNTGN